MDKNVKLFTSNFSSMRKLPKNFIPISIAISSPKWYDGRKLDLFMPPWSLVRDYKNGMIDERQYEEIYCNHLSIRENEINKFINYLKNTDEILVFLCYEKSTDFCHRHLVSKYLSKYDIIVEEY